MTLVIFPNKERYLQILLFFESILYLLDKIKLHHQQEFRLMIV